jgi:hypothetical protein
VRGSDTGRYSETPYRLGLRDSAQYPANKRNKPEKLKPSASIRVVQSPRRHRGAGRKRREPKGAEEAGTHISQNRGSKETMKVHHQNSARDAQPLKSTNFLRQAFTAPAGGHVPVPPTFSFRRD